MERMSAGWCWRQRGCAGWACDRASRPWCRWRSPYRHPGQGTVAIEARTDDTAVLDTLRQIGDDASMTALVAERAVVSRLGGGCQMPIGAFASVAGDAMTMKCIVVSPDGARAARAEVSGPSGRAARHRRGSRRAAAGGRRRRNPGRASMRRRVRQQRPMMKPSVYLIGAGPGDPGLITVHGLECLRRADVVIYDHLVSPRLLRHAKHTSELIDVGTAAPQAMEQEAISYLLAEKAREGKVVARLKWGDPFVFDRGGEEALFLQQQRDRVRGRARHSRRASPCRLTPASRSPTRAAATPSRSCAGSRTKAGRRRRSTGPAWCGSRARSCVTPGRSSCR